MGAMMMRHMVIRSVVLVLVLVATRAQANPPLEGWPQIGWGNVPTQGLASGVPPTGFGYAVENVVLIDGASILLFTVGQPWDQSGLLKLTPQGVPDLMFGADGYILAPTMHFRPLSAAIDAGGQLLVTGKVFEEPFVCRFDVLTGNPITFSGSDETCVSAVTGMVETTFETLIQADGKILLAGIGRPAQGLSRSLLAIRFNTNGSLDTSYGGEGIVSLALPSNSYFMSAKLASNGKLVSAYIDIAGFEKASLITRISPDGSVDAGWNARPFSVSIGHVDWFLDIVLVDTPSAEDDIIAAGSTGADGIDIEHGLIARIDGTTGAFDPKFGTSNGYTEFPAFVRFDRLAHHGNGGWLAMMGSTNPVTVLGVARNGMVDPTFGNAGVFVLEDPNNAVAAGYALRVDGDGVYIAGNYLENGAPAAWYEVKLARDYIFADDLELH